MAEGLGRTERRRLDQDGAVMVRPDLDLAALASALAPADQDFGAGRRFFHAPEPLKPLLAPFGPLGAIAASALSPAARPTRMIVFDKTEAKNWAVAWHQDRTIAVAARAPVQGYDIWSKKDGVDHVEPPFDVIARTFSLRLHLDDAGPDNAPLLTVRGSHTLGKLPADAAGDYAATGKVDTHCARAGDLLVVRTAVLHASHRARAPRRRRVLHLDFCDADLPAPLQWAFAWEGAHA
ncbi:MAG: phytanoyl-CoA dioxygenase family protein [Oceanicaulis sp.]